MATLFEPSFSTSLSTRPPFSSASAPSMADTLPNINFGFEDLRSRMASFTTRFDIFIAQGRARVLEERNEFRFSVAELHESQRIKKRAIDDFAQKTTSHAQSLAREAAETQDMHVAVAAISAQRDARASARNRLRSEIAFTQQQIETKLAAQRDYAARLDAQSRHNGPELDFWTDYLCLRIEGVGQVDRLRFVFTHVDERDWERECGFELNTEEREYRVEEESVIPRVSREELDTVVERLNHSRDLGGFLKGMRGLFEGSIQQA